VVQIVLELNPSGWRCVSLVVANTSGETSMSTL
jgi:hypothetical protein